MMKTDIQDIVIGRLPLYLRALQRMTQEGRQVTSSQELGERLGISAAQIRKDLSQFGEFGKQGTGYNIEFLMGADKKAAGRAQELINQGMVNIEPLTYIRGRSIPNQFLIVDESQNLTPHEIKTIITRAGEDTKMVFTGDIEQIDSPYLDEKSNGLSYLTDKMNGQDLFAHVNLVKGERSYLAELASHLL